MADWFCFSLWGDFVLCSFCAYWLPVIWLRFFPLLFFLVCLAWWCFVLALFSSRIFRVTPVRRAGLVLVVFLPFSASLVFFLYRVDLFFLSFLSPSCFDCFRGPLWMLALSSVVCLYSVECFLGFFYLLVLLPGVRRVLVSGVLWYISGRKPTGCFPFYWRRGHFGWMYRPAALPVLSLVFCSPMMILSWLRCPPASLPYPLPFALLFRHHQIYHLATTYVISSVYVPCMVIIHPVSVRATPVPRIFPLSHRSPRVPMPLLRSSFHRFFV